jgi:hypothetical protein
MPPQLSFSSKKAGERFYLNGQTVFAWDHVGRPQLLIIYYYLIGLKNYMSSICLIKVALAHWKNLNTTILVYMYARLAS